MKTLNRLYAPFIGLLLLGPVACQRETTSITPELPATTTLADKEASLSVDNIRLKQMVADGDCGGLGPFWLTTRFQYGTGRNLSKAVIAASATELTNEYTYDAQGRVISLLSRYATPNGDGSVADLNTFTFGQNTIERRFARLTASGEKMPSAEKDARNVYKFNAEGQITEWLMDGIIRFGETTKQRYVYTYENGNVVKAELRNEADAVEFTLTYQYDNKINPFYNWMFVQDPVLRSSRNNVVAAQFNGVPSRRTEYTYNDKNLPITQKDMAKGCTMTFEYETF